MEQSDPFRLIDDWLETQAKPILQGAPPGKLAPPDTIGFTLVLLSKSPHPEQLREGLARVGCLDPCAAAAVVEGACPQIVATGLTLDDALLGQLECACHDSAAVFLRDAVAASEDSTYLCEIYSDLLASDEFRPVDVEIHSVPIDHRGKQFLDRFAEKGDVWGHLVALPLRLRVLNKKARLMRHWGLRIGADVRVAD